MESTFSDGKNLHWKISFYKPYVTLFLKHNRCFLLDVHCCFRALLDLKQGWGMFSESGTGDPQKNQLRVRDWGRAEQAQVLMWVPQYRGRP